MNGQTQTWNERLETPRQSASNRRLGLILLAIFLALSAFSVGLILVRAKNRPASIGSRISLTAPETARGRTFLCEPRGRAQHKTTSVYAPQGESGNGSSWQPVAAAGVRAQRMQRPTRQASSNGGHAAHVRLERSRFDDAVRVAIDAAAASALPAGVSGGV